MKILLTLAAIIALGIFFLGMVRYLEKVSIYFPMKEIAATPEAVGLSYEDIYFRASDGNLLNGWFIAGDTNKVTIILCHGNAGNISHRLEKLSMFHEMGFSVLVFDYRGYGKSEGVPSEEGLYTDAMAAYTYLRGTREVPEEEIVLYGESIGGAVVIDLAQKADVRALITEGTFTSVRDMARTAYPFIPSFVFSDKFDSVDKISRIGCSKLMIHSANDEIVPFYMGRKLFNAAQPPKEFLEIRGSHNTAFLDSEREFKEGIRSFVDDL
ncbi:MAG: alpha/beta fold hydrolase [Candidatus Omnitrophica bacterium]|nr:alpha/beta fold hydrolase [Candidatus Omnitrophota bacterium]